MRTSIRLLVSAGMLTSTIACQSQIARSSSSSGDRARSQAGIVLGADQFQNRAGTFLTILSGRVSGIQVRRTSAPCPEVTVRGVKSILGSNDPAVYVDGVRTSNTCVLDGINPTEVSRVEFYPMGVSPRPPYRGHPNGLILVFMMDGRERRH